MVDIEQEVEGNFAAKMEQILSYLNTFRDDRSSSTAICIVSTGTHDGAISQSTDLLVILCELSPNDKGILVVW